MLWVERVWPALWPAFALVGAWIVLALFDLPQRLPAWWHLAALGLLLAALVASVWLGLRRVRRPGDAEVDRRLEHASGLRHRPLVVLDDRPADAASDPATAALWQAHTRRAADQVARLRAGWPHPGIPQRDVWAARAALAVLIAAGLVVAGADTPGRLLRSVWPGLPDAAAAPAPQLQAWLTPPAYTGVPPIFLHPGEAPPPIPAGSHLTVNLTGGAAVPTMSYRRPGDASSPRWTPPAGRRSATWRLRARWSCAAAAAKWGAGR